jgi:hypothetical protein
MNHHILIENTNEVSGIFDVIQIDLISVKNQPEFEMLMIETKEFEI